MKKALLSGIVALAALQLAAEISVPATGWQISKDAVNPAAVNGVFTATSSGSDTILKITDFKQFPAGANDLLVFSMRFPEGKKTMFQMFWASKELPNYSETNSIRQAITGTGELETYCVNLSGHKGWTGTITNLRIDPVSIPKNAPEAFAIGEFKIIDAAAGMPVPARNWGGATNCKLTGSGDNVATGEFIGKGDPFIGAAPPAKIDASTLKTVEFELKLPQGSAPTGQLFWMPEGQKAYSEPCSARFKIPADGEFHKVTIDLSKKAEWTGSIVALRFDMTDKPAQSGEFQLKNFTVK